MARTLYLVGGPMGVGKTTLCRLLEHRLPACAFLDGDWCWEMDPFVVTEETRRMVLDNIVYLLNSFLHCSVYENVVFGWVLHLPETWAELEARLDTAGWRVVRTVLVCAPEQLRARLEADIAAGRRPPDCVPRALDRLETCRRLPAAWQLDTTALSPAHVADRLLAGTLEKP